MSAPHQLGSALPLLAFAVATAAAQPADTTIRMAGTPRFAGVAAVAEELTIGALNGAEEYTFGRISDIAVSENGTMYVLDQSLNSIRMYAADGKYIGTFARAGQGPGEIATASGMGFLRDGRFAVYDTRNWRVNIYSAAGENITQWPVPSEGAVMASRSMAVDTAGFVYLRKSRVERDASVSGVRVTQYYLKLRGSDGAVLDTISEPAFTPFPDPFRAESDRGWRQVAMPYAAPRLWTMSPHGLSISAVPERYAFETQRPGGPGPIVSVRRNVAPEEIPVRERNARRADIEARMREVDPRWSWGTRDIPRVRPLFTALSVGADGRIWLTRRKSEPRLVSAPNSSGRTGGGAASTVDVTDTTFVWEATLFDVFESDGRFVGSVSLPPKVNPLYMRGDLVWAVAKDDNEVDFVKRYRIVWR